LRLELADPLLERAQPRVALFRQPDEIEDLAQELALGIGEGAAIRRPNDKIRSAHRHRRAVLIRRDTALEPESGVQQRGQRSQDPSRRLSDPSNGRSLREKGGPSGVYPKRNACSYGNKSTTHARCSMRKRFTPARISSPLWTFVFCA